jgi:hypothetical protein
MNRFAASIAFAFAAFALTGAMTGNAAAAPVPFFTEDFETGPSSSALNAPTVGQFNVTLGTVDYIRTPNGFGIASCGAGGSGCVDLAGTSNEAASRIATAVLNFQPGSYVLTFDISGNQRDTLSDSIRVLIPGLLGPITESRNGALGFTTLTYSFVVAIATNASIIFEGLTGEDNIGVLLDNIRVTFDAAPVPLPGAMPLLMAGIAGLAFASRRPRRH